MRNKRIIEEFFRTNDYVGKPVDLDTLMNYYAEEVVFPFTINPTLKGKAAIREALSKITA